MLLNSQVMDYQKNLRVGQLLRKMADLLIMSGVLQEMYAIITNGGKQYKVAEGQIIKLESVNSDAGNELTFNQILLLADGDRVTVGAPFVAHATVIGEVVSHGRGKKVHIIKFRRRKHHMKRMGHRQNYTSVKITGIHVGKE